MKHLVAFALFCTMFVSELAFSAPTVVTSIAPIQFIVSAVMGERGPPEVLLPAGTSVHGASLKPSDAHKLHSSDLVIWVGPSLEAGLEKPLENLIRAPIIVQLDLYTDLVQLPMRTAIEWGELSDEHGHHHDHHHHHGHADPHFWLSPENAKLIAEITRDQLMLIDPHHAVHYQENTEAFIKKLETLDLKIAEQLSSFQQVPYLVFHDAYQYFEQHYGLSGVGTLHLSGQEALSIKRIHKIRDMIQAHNVACLFREPQFSERNLNSITEGFQLETGLIDPLGVGIMPHADSYLVLLENISEAFFRCFSQAAKDN